MSNTTVTPFLMFDGQAEAAMNFYTSLFDNAEILNVVRYEEGQPGKAGTIMNALFSLNGSHFMCLDSNVEHDFTFTPAISLFVATDTVAEIDKLYNALSKDGKIFMELNSYGFSDKYAWLEDRFGVCWQLFLNAPQ